MSKLIWGAAGERQFETGVDRGVLYLPGRDGIAWSGLTSVQESPSGGSSKGYYLDGFKYANVATLEEYEATIEAFSAPYEFGECDGTAEIHRGLFVTEQPRKPFSFSYRTLIGNDLESTEFGYKLHIVYNALAEPADRTYNTLSDDPSAESLSWHITTQPSVIPGRKPTAHLIIDSRRTPELLMSYIEDILYGTDISRPRLPPFTEIYNAFMNPGPGQRKNYFTDPRVKSINTFSYQSGTNEVGTNSVVTSANDGPLTLSGIRLDSYVRRTVTTAKTYGSSGFYSYNKTFAPVLNGSQWQVSMYIRPSVNLTVALTTSGRNNGSLVGGATSSPSVVLPAGEWSKLVGVPYVANTDTSGIGIWAVIAANSILPVGATLDVTGLLVEKNLTSEYFDGDFGVIGDTTYEWEDVPNASASVLRSWHKI